MKVLRFLSFFSIFFFFCVSVVLAQTFPKPVGYVNDFANLYSESFEQTLEQELKELEASTSAEIAVVTVENLQDTSIEDYAVRLFENWKIGKEKQDNGVLVLIAREEREARIEVGYGLEGAITDARAGRIIREQMIPAFRQNDYEKGTKAAVEVVKKYIRGEAVPEEKEPQNIPDWSGWLDVIPFLFFALIYAASFLARSKDFYAGGIIGAIVGVIIGLIIGELLAVLFTGFVLGMIGILLDYILSRNYQRLKAQHKSTDWWHSGGGFFGGGRSSGGGFGGFGGGSSGGGGASGRW